MGRVMAIAAVVLVGLGGWLLVRGEVPCDVLAVQPACEVAVLPGPSEDSVELVSLDGTRAYPPDGQLRLTTIAVQDDLDLRTWLHARTSGAIDAVPRESVFPPGADREEVAEQNAVMMADSQLMATVAALTEAGYTLTGEGALVAGLTPDAVTEELAPGDVIVGVDGAVVHDSRDVVEAVQANDPGDTLRLDVEEADGAARTVPVTLGTSTEEPGTAYIGVLLTTDLELPFDVTIDAGAIGGPSAGLIFALSIVELLEPDDLTAGAIIAGTGTMDGDGVVGSVGGVRQKVVGATTSTAGEEPATVFLVPEGNLADARRATVDSDVLLVPVGTLDEALGALEDLREGRDPRDAVVLAAGG